MLDTIAKIAYGTMLLAMIMHTPRMSMLITLDPNRTNLFHAGIKGFKKSVLLAALFTLMAALPPHYFNGSVKPSKKLFLPFVMPWVFTCCLMFVSNSVLLVKITQRSLVCDTWHSFAAALLLYCTVFGLAIEMMLHWFSIYHLHECNHLIDEIFVAL